MTTVTYQTCKFCGKTVEQKKTEMSRFSMHVFTVHKDEPEVKRYLQIQAEQSALLTSFSTYSETVRVDGRGEK